MLVALALTVTAGATALDTTMVTALLVTVAGLAQAALLVSCTVTTSPLARLLLVKVALLVPALLLFTFHWYTGVLPPLTGVAVNVTGVPVQIVVLPAAIVTEGVTEVFTVMVIAFDVSFCCVKQLALVVSTQVTTSPLLNDEVLSVALLVPTTVLLRNHW
jgi:hypothetical protein